MNRKKVVVLGCNGMAGHIMAEYLDGNDDFEVYGVARESGKFVTEEIDVLKFTVLEHFLNKIQPDYVINCIGLLVKNSSENIEQAILVNSYLPHFLSNLGKKIEFKLIHISTDCVFSGKEGGYSEDSFRDGDDNYARTKSLGEIVNERDLTIRTSIIGPEIKSNGTGLLDWFFKQSGEVNGYTKAYWSGVTTFELAKATVEFINQNVTGLYHLCPENKISKYELLKVAKIVFDRSVEIKPIDSYNVDKGLLCTRKEFNYFVPDYPEMLEELRSWMNDHADYYSHYK